MTYPGLPKWPQMYTTGKPVTLEQAKEIIRRTDTFFHWPEYAGNDRAYAQRVIAALKVPIFEQRHDGDISGLNEHWKLEEAWRARWGYIHTEYVSNSWLACAFIFGPHGWCHPDGSIGFIDNIGKWPSCEEVIDEWRLIAEAFPFLHIDVTLMSGEECDSNIVPVFGLTVRGTVVEACDPQLLHKEHPKPCRFRADMSDEDCIRARFGEGFHDNRSERGIPWSWIEQWAKLPQLIE